jgi:hypothetical protein
MTRRTLHPAVLVGLGLVAGTLGTSAWLQAQVAEPRHPTPQEVQLDTRPQQPGRVYSGDDIAFRVVGRNGRTPIVVLVVKLNGEWVDVEFGGGGIRKLTQ